MSDGWASQDAQSWSVAEIEAWIGEALLLLWIDLGLDFEVVPSPCIDLSLDLETVGLQLFDIGVDLEIIGSKVVGIGSDLEVVDNTWIADAGTDLEVGAGVYVFDIVGLDLEAVASSPSSRAIIAQRLSSTLTPIE